MIPRTYQPGKVVGVDVIYIPGIGGETTVPALNMVDWGTNYQMVEKLNTKQPEEVWKAMTRTWLRVFGCPEVIITDPGREFLSSFLKNASAEGIVVHNTAARAPWQQGKTERHGGHFKELLAKSRAEMVITNLEELRQLMGEVEQAKNRFSNRSGFSPVQRQIGQWPRTPSQILSDDALDPALLHGVRTDEIEQLHEMRRVAQKAFVEHNATNILRRTLKSKGRGNHEFQAGDYVFVYRVPKARKRRQGGAEVYEVATNRATWVGPGTIIVEDGASLWVSMLGELWRVAKEQCRPATNTEKEGIEAVNRECRELVEEYKRNPHRAGYRDVTQEPWPEEAEDEEDQGGSKRRRVEGAGSQAMDQQVEDGGPDLGGSGVATAAAAPTSPPATPMSQSQPTIPPSLSEEVHPITSEEPEAEAIQSSTEGGDTMKLPAPSHGMPPINYQDPRIQRAAQDSLARSNQLDDMPPPGEPWRWRTRGKPMNPYYAGETEIFLETVEDDPTESTLEEEQDRLDRLLQQTVHAKKKDYWEVDFEKGELRRIHQKKRKVWFDPWKSPWLPIPEGSLQSQRKTCVEFTGGSRERKEEEDSWRWRAKMKESHWWKGQTIFYFNKQEVSQGQIEGPAAYVVQRKGQDEVDPKNEDPEGQARWKESDLAEWNKVVNSGAVEVLSLEESRRIRAELRHQGREQRILPTKTARRYKPAELPGQPPTRKSRVCLRGDLDPDILELERFSPTINTLNFNLLLQTAANSRMNAVVADFSNAFCQSKPLNRPNGNLYFSPPKDGIEGVSPETLVRIVSGVYGLVDAPLHWRKSLVQDLHALGYYESKLDPCIFKLHAKDGELLGAVAVEVDDLFMVGGEAHERKMRSLRDKYKFGKWVELKKEKEGCSFNGRRIRQGEDSGFVIDMEKFIAERLNPISLEKGRASKKKEEATEEERHAARAACGALNWLSKEGRPDAAGPSSLLSSRLGMLTVEDLVSINEVIKVLKENADLTIKIQPLKQMRLSVITDASFANSGFHSQGGHLVVAHEKELANGELVTANVITWRSGKLQRVVNSTLAAETQSLSRGLGDLPW